MHDVLPLPDDRGDSDRHADADSHGSSGYIVLPTSLVQAITELSTDDWDAIARDVFLLEPERVSFDDILTRVELTNVCTDDIGPLEFWIDAAGTYRLKVYR